MMQRGLALPTVKQFSTVQYSTGQLITSDNGVPTRLTSTVAIANALVCSMRQREVRRAAAMPRCRDAAMLRCYDADEVTAVL